MNTEKAYCTYKDSLDIFGMRTSPKELQDIACTSERTPNIDVRAYFKFTTAKMLHTV